MLNKGPVLILHKGERKIAETLHTPGHSFAGNGFRFTSSQKITTIETGDGIIGFGGADLFKEAGEENLVHIRVLSRNARKKITIVEGLPEKLNLKKALSLLQKVCPLSLRSHSL